MTFPSRGNWWWFWLTFTGPFRYPTWRLKYDLRCWMFGWTYQFGAWKFSFGPFEAQQITTISPPEKADLQAVK